MPAMFAMVNDPHPPLPPNISQPLRDFLLQCFTKEIQKRPTAIMLLEHPWIVSNTKAEPTNALDDKASANSDEVNQTLTCDNPQIMARMQQLEKENENLNSTVRSLKMHLLKMMKEKKNMRTQIESLEQEIASLQQSQSLKSVGSGQLSTTSASVNSNGLQISSSRGHANIALPSKSASKDTILAPLESKKNAPADSSPTINAGTPKSSSGNTHLKPASEAHPLAASLPNIPTVDEAIKAQTFKHGDKCKIRMNPTSGTWHRATIENITSHGTAIIVLKSSGKREEVPLSNIKEKTKKKSGSSGRGEKNNNNTNNGNKKHVASIFSFKH